MVAEPIGNQSPVAKRCKCFLPAQEDGVFSKVGIDLFGIELIQNVFPVDFRVVLPGDIFSFEFLDQRPGRAEFSVVPGVFEPDKLFWIAPGYSHKIKTRFSDPVGKVV